MDDILTPIPVDFKLMSWSDYTRIACESGLQVNTLEATLYLPDKRGIRPTVNIEGSSTVENILQVSMPL